MWGCHTTYTSQICGVVTLLTPARYVWLSHYLHQPDMWGCHTTYTSQNKRREVSYPTYSRLIWGGGGCHTTYTSQICGGVTLLTPARYVGLSHYLHQPDMWGCHTTYTSQNKRREVSYPTSSRLIWGGGGGVSHYLHQPDMWGCHTTYTSQNKRREVSYPTYSRLIWGGGGVVTLLTPARYVGLSHYLHQADMWSCHTTYTRQICGVVTLLTPARYVGLSHY